MWLVVACSLVPTMAVAQQGGFRIGMWTSSRDRQPGSFQQSEYTYRLMDVLRENYANLLGNALPEAPAFTLEMARLHGSKVVFYGPPAGPVAALGLTPAQRDALVGFNVTLDCDNQECTEGPNAGQLAALASVHTDGDGAAAYVNIGPSVWTSGTTLSQWFHATENSLEADIGSSTAYLNRNWVDPEVPNPQPPIVDFVTIKMRLRSLVAPDHTAWALTSPWTFGDASYPAGRPNASDMRLNVLLPVAIGALGVMYYEPYRAAPELWKTREVAFLDRRQSVISEDFIPTTYYWQLREINHFLRDVVGPVVLSSTLTGVYSGGDLPVDAMTASAPVQQVLCDSTLVSVFHPDGGEPDDNYLFVLNTQDAGVSGTIGIAGDAAQGLAVGAASSVIGYVGGTAYAPVQVVPDGISNGRWTGHFAVNLAAGEGRMFRLQPTTTPNAFVAVTEPAGAVQWAPGETRTVSWTGFDGEASVFLYSDVRTPYSSLAGFPGTGVSLGHGTSPLQVTVPNIPTRNARIVVSGTAMDASEVQAGSEEVRILSASSQSYASWPVVAADGFSQSAIALDQGVPIALGFGAWDERLYEARYVTTASPWTTTAVWDGLATPVSATYYPQGLWPSLAIRASEPSVVHAAFYVIGRSNSAPATVRYGVRTGTSTGAWSFETVDAVGADDSGGAIMGGTSIALDAAGQPYIAYNSGTAGDMTLKIRHRAWNPQGSGHWEWQEVLEHTTPPPGASYVNPQSITLQLDSNGKLWTSFVSRYTGITNDPTTQQPMAANPVFRLCGVAHDPQTATTTPLPVISIVGSSAAMALGANGLPVVAYFKTVAGGQVALVTSVYNAATSSWGAPVTIETLRGTPTGLAMNISMVNSVTTTHIAYAINGVLREAVNFAGSWTIRNLVPDQSVSGPLSMAVSAAGTQWVSYWNRTGSSTSVVRVPAPSGGSGGGDPPIDYPAIDMRSENPMVANGRLSFAIHLPKSAGIGIALYDVAGRRVAERAVEQLSGGDHQLQWQPALVAPGLYFVRVTLGERVAMDKRVVMIR